MAGHIQLDSKKPRARAGRNPGLRIHSLSVTEERRSEMNPINDITRWPLTGDHPSWCHSWWCRSTDLGHEHRSDPTTFTLGDDRWELTLLRADEPGTGETQICAVVTSGAYCQPPVGHMLSLSDAGQLAEQLRDIAEQARAEEAAPLLEVVR